MPIDPSVNKRLQVILSNEEYELFRQYAEATSWAGPRKRSMSELAADFIRMQLWRQTECCLVADELVNEAMVKDPRQNKLCWGFKCSYCTIQEGCMAGARPAQLPADRRGHQRDEAKGKGRSIEAQGR